MKKVFIGLGIVAIVIPMVTGLFNGGLFGLIYGILSGVLSGGLYIGFAIVLDKLEELQQEIRYAGENARATLLHTVGDIRCTNCGHTMPADYTACPACGSRELVSGEKTI